MGTPRVDPRLAVLYPGIAAPQATSADVEAPDRRASHRAAVLFAIAAFGLYVAIALGGGGGRALAYTFPAGCFLIALFAYLRDPVLYFHFTWWTWLLTPFLRRLFDLRYGYHPTSTLLLGPLFATAIAAFTVVHRHRSLRNNSYLPFLIAIAALVYAFLIGIIQQSLVAAAFDLLNWTAPLLFGMHIALTWEQFPSTRRALTGSVLAGLIVTSLYAIFQWVAPPVWDRVWVVSAEMLSVGMPLPFLIRVFSTLNAPGPFALLLVFGLLIGLTSRQRWRYLALALAFVSLMLTKGRSAWGGFLLGTLVLQLKQPVRELPRQWVAILAVALLAAPLALQPRVLGVFSQRAATLSRIHGDRSFQARVDFTRFFLSQLGKNPAGNGLGGLGGASKLITGGRSGFAFDSGVLEIYGVMGWVGGTLFMMALLAIILSIVRTRTQKQDPLTNGAVACTVAFLFSSLFGNVFTGVSGFLFWCAVGVAAAGRNYVIALDLATRYRGRVEVRPRGTAVSARIPAA